MAKIEWTDDQLDYAESRLNKRTVELGYEQPPSEAMIDQLNKQKKFYLFVMIADAVLLLVIIGITIFSIFTGAAFAAFIGGIGLTCGLHSFVLAFKAYRETNDAKDLVNRLEARKQ